MRTRHSMIRRGGSPCRVHEIGQEPLTVEREPGLGRSAGAAAGRTRGVIRPCGVRWEGGSAVGVLSVAVAVVVVLLAVALGCSCPDGGAVLEAGSSSMIRVSALLKASMKSGGACANEPSARSGEIEAFSSCCLASTSAHSSSDLSIATSCPVWGLKCSRSVMGDVPSRCNRGSRRFAVFARPKPTPAQ
jgi:hypothetical protein